MKSLFFLGRQPALGMAELETLFGADAIAPLTDNIVISTIDADKILFSSLGGCIKSAEIIETLHNANWQQAEKALFKLAPGLAKSIAEGKIRFGLSTYNIDVSSKDIQATALRLKKLIRAKTNRSVRVVPTHDTALTTPQVIHNELMRSLGLEIVLVKAGDRIIVARTIDEQDIEAYTKRDQARPKRDARVGMLPPKLAQIIVNLAAESDTSILDPFCGTGVVLQEAALMHRKIYGSDVEPRMIEYTRANLEWLSETHGQRPPDMQKVTLEVADATSHKWKEGYYSIACEGYLGQPFSTFPDEAKLREVMQTCNTIAKKFLKNVATQVDRGSRHCVALPAWHKPNGQFIHLKLLDELEDLGYNRMSFVHVRDEDLLYYRPDQVVARELLVITRK